MKSVQMGEHETTITVNRSDAENKTTGISVAVVDVVEDHLEVVGVNKVSRFFVTVSINKQGRAVASVSVNNNNGGSTTKSVTGFKRAIG